MKAPETHAEEPETPEGPGRNRHRQVDVHVDDAELDFVEAKRIADRAAREEVQNPMLLAWFSRRTREHSPRVECCGDDKPAWLVYAESRGGNLMIRLNDGEYLFVYR